MNNIKLILKLLYFFIPRIIRQQFLDDPIFLIKEVFKHIFFKIKSRFKGNEDKESIFLLVSNINNLGCEYDILFSKFDRENFINSPKLYLEGRNYFKPEIKGNLPDINIYWLKKVSIIGSTDAIMFENKFLHHELNLMEYMHDLKRWDIFKKIDKKRYELSLIFNKEQNFLNKNKKYISLLKEHSINYYHFMTEGLPRLIEIVEFFKRQDVKFNIKDYILLIDDEMPTQCLEAINIILNDSCEIIFVKKGEIFYCEELIYCTPLWTSLDNTTGLPNPKKEFFVDKYAINLVREKILASFVPKIKNTNKLRKVYLQRLNNKLRPISNLNQLELVLLKNNFEFIDVGSLNLKEQIELFQSVDIVIGVSGASFTNLIFMKNGSKAINFYPSVSATNYYLFQPLADISDVDLIHFLTIVKEGEVSIHSEASIDIESLNLLLKEENEL